MTVSNHELARYSIALALDLAIDYQVLLNGITV